MKKYFRFYIIIVISITFFSLNIGINCIAMESIFYLNTVTATEFDTNSYNNILREYYEQATEKGILFNSDKLNLKAFLNRKSGRSDIQIVWEKSTLNIPVKGQVGYIRWRPKHSSFIYSLLDEDSEGDFGTSSMHYVDLNYFNKKIIVKDLEITSHQVDTDLGWSSNGKYYAYSETSSLRIKNFDTGKIWATKLILISSKLREVKIVENNSNELGGFFWVDNDKRILFFWKNNPLDDTAVGYAAINTKQFGLN